MTFEENKGHGTKKKSSFSRPAQNHKHCRHKKITLQDLKAPKGIIEIVNSADHGRVCTLQVSDFQSPENAQVYAALIKLAPELLDDYLSDTKKRKEVFARFNKKLARIKKKKPRV